MDAQLIGYVRVSSRDQKEDRQVIAMRNFGIAEENILIEKMSGKNFDRPIYKRLVTKLRPGDVLVVKSLDRLGRDYKTIIEEWRHITKKLGVSIVVLDMPLLDTRKKDYDLTTSFIADIVLQILSYVAETERVFNHQRQAEGIAVAKAKGIKFGRRAIEKPKEFESVHKHWKDGEISASEAARRLGISRPTFMSWANNN